VSFQQAFLKQLNELPADALIYIDECGIDQYLYREYAYSRRGEKVVAKISGKKFKRTNIVAGICCGKWVAPLTYNGTTDSILFEYWFENCLLKEAKPGSIFILDNATFHRKSMLSALAELDGCRVLFLPPYSPELNPIENKWAWLKKKLRKILPDFESFDSALLACF
jgi:transposase